MWDDIIAWLFILTMGVLLVIAAYWDGREHQFNKQCEVSCLPSKYAVSTPSIDWKEWVCACQQKEAVP